MNASEREREEVENVRCIAVDWSGAVNLRYQREHIWVAEAAQGRLIQLRNGQNRRDVVDYLLRTIRGGGPLVIGLDFAFSFPRWYLEEHHLENVQALWTRAADQGERWLKGQTWPFWGLPGPFNNHPEDLTEDLELRETDWVNDGEPVFHVHGGANVGTGTIRGLPHLTEMRCAGATIWPFDAPVPGSPNVIEIYPRVFYGHGVTKKRDENGRNSRRRYLERNYPDLERPQHDAMVVSDDAFDAGVSALVMSAHIGALQRLQPATEPPISLEGEIWVPLMRRWFHV